MLGRMIRAAGRRVGDADEVELRQLIELLPELERAIAAGMAGQMSYGRSWSHIAQATGTTRQGTRQRWERLVKEIESEER